MSKRYSPKVERQIIRRIINQGLLNDDVEEAHAQVDEKYERYLEKQERRALRKSKREKNKGWDDA